MAGELTVGPATPWLDIKVDTTEIELCLLKETSLVVDLWKMRKDL